MWVKLRGQTLQDQKRPKRCEGTMIARLICSAVLSLSFFLSSCSSYRPIQVEGKTPIYCFKQEKATEAIEIMTKMMVDFAKQAEAFAAKHDERKTGDVTWNISIAGASGKGPDGVLADGYVVLEKLKIQGGKGSATRQELESMIQRLRKNFLKTLNTLAQPVYVERYKLD
jgi:hypothetical protein